MEKAAKALERIAGDLLVSKRKLKRIGAVEVVRMQRAEGKQDVAFSSRPFTLCSLPIRRPPKGELVHNRQNGKFTLRVCGDPEYGLPFGQDRLLPIWVATMAVRQQSREIRFSAAAEILDTFGLPKDGPHYRRLIASFNRVFYSTIYFGSDETDGEVTVVKRHSFRFFRDIQLWYSRDVNQRSLPGDLENIIVLSEEFWRELQDHPIPIDLTVVRELANNAGALDFYTWMTWRCWTAKKLERIPLFGTNGLNKQLGVIDYVRDRKFRERIRGWLRLVHAFWPKCPVRLSDDGRFLLIEPGKAILPRRKAVDFVKPVSRSLKRDESQMKKRDETQMKKTRQ